MTLPPNQLIHFSTLDEILFLSLDEASSRCAIHVPRVLNGRFQSGGSASLRLGFAVENEVLPFLSIRRWGSSQSSRAINKALGLQGQEVSLQSHDQMQYMDHIESPMSHCRNIFLMYIVGHMGGGECVVLICPVASSCGQPPGATPIHLSPHSFIPSNSALETNFLK